MKKKKLAIVLSSIAVIALIGGTYAAFTASSSPINKTVSTSKLKIDIEQTADADKEHVTLDGGKIVYTGGLPGDVIDSSVKIKNTENKDCYVRVTITKNWLDEEGSKILDDALADPKEIGVEPDQTDWIVQEPADDPEIVYCYYREPLAAGQETANVINRFSILEKTKDQPSNKYAGLGTEITFDAEAIQNATDPAEPMLAAWGVVATFEADGTLTSVVEQ